MTHDKKQPGLPVVEVDQAFPLMTADGLSRQATSAEPAGDQAPTVAAAIRDVLGWRPRVQDPKAFLAALGASFELSIQEDHVVSRYVPRGVAVQADLGAVTGGQASLYLRAKAAHEQITRMLDSLKPLRTDADPEDCEAYRGLVRDSVRRIVAELGREGGPRVPLVDSAFTVLIGYRPSPGTAPLTGASPSPVTANAILGPSVTFGGSRNPVPAATAATDPDTVPGQLGALRDRFGLDDDHVNTVDEEKQRTSFWTLVELVADLQRSWDLRRLDFTRGDGNGFLGTDLVQVSRLLAACAEQVDELEAVLDSVLVSAAERQTIALDVQTGLSLDDLVQWLRVFVTEDGPNIIRDTGRDGLVSSFTPTVVALLLAFRDRLVRPLIPCASSGCAGGCVCGSRNLVTCIPLGCCTKLPPGMHSGRVKIAVSTLCGLLERLARKAIRIGRYAGAVLLDLTIQPFESATKFVRVEVRGLHLRPTYVPAFLADGMDPADPAALVLPLQGSASADSDSLIGIFDSDILPTAVRNLLSGSGVGIVMAASEAPLAVVDGELGRLVQGPAVTTWPSLRRSSNVDPADAPNQWGSVAPNQRFVPQAAPSPIDPDPADDDCLVGCDDECDGCDCGCHPMDKVCRGLARASGVAQDERVVEQWQQVRETLTRQGSSIMDLLQDHSLLRLVDAVIEADRRLSQQAATGSQGGQDTLQAMGTASPEQTDEAAPEPMSNDSELGPDGGSSGEATGAHRPALAGADAGAESLREQAAQPGQPADPDPEVIPPTGGDHETKSES